MAFDPETPIVIKRVKKVEGGHHGGAWKVAYADFVTAMMAFFLLLWLISSTSKSQKEGIAEYFTPTVGLRDEAGIGFKGGEAPSPVGTMKNDLTRPGIVHGTPTTGPLSDEEVREAMEEADNESKLFQKAEDDIKQAIESDPNLRDFKDNILMEQNPEGLKIQIVDQGKYSMFESGSAMLSPYGKTILRKLGEIVQKLPNRASIIGHTDSSPLTKASEYTNWELSSDRANSARRYMLGIGFDPQRIAKVVGRASQEPLLKDAPQDPRNRRISIIMLRRSMDDAPPGALPAPRSLLTPPKVTQEGQIVTPIVSKEPAKKPEPGQKPATDNASSPLPQGGLPTGQTPAPAPVEPKTPAAVAPAPADDGELHHGAPPGAKVE